MPSKSELCRRTGQQDACFHLDTGSRERRFPARASLPTEGSVAMPAVRKNLWAAARTDHRTGELSRPGTATRFRNRHSLSRDRRTRSASHRSPATRFRNRHSLSRRHLQPPSNRGSLGEFEQLGDSAFQGCGPVQTGHSSDFHLSKHGLTPFVESQQVALFFPLLLLRTRFFPT